jgi:hypothetical protein
MYMFLTKHNPQMLIDMHVARVELYANNCIMQYADAINNGTIKINVVDSTIKITQPKSWVIEYVIPQSK